MIVIVEKDKQTDKIEITLDQLKKLINEAKEEGRQEAIKDYESVPY